MKKIIIIGIIALFFGISVQPAFAIEKYLSTDDIIVGEDCDCQVEDNINQMRAKFLLTRIKNITNNVLSKYGHIPEVKETCEKVIEITNSEGFLENFCLGLGNIILIIWHMYTGWLVDPVGFLFFICTWWPLILPYGVICKKQIEIV